MSTTNPTPNIAPPIPFPLDRWFECTTVGPRGIAEQFWYNPTQDAARVYRGGYRITIVFTYHKPLQLGDKAMPLALFLQDDECGRYRPTDAQLLAIMPPQLTAALVTKVDSGSWKTHPVTMMKMPVLLGVNCAPLVQLYGWQQSLANSPFASVMDEVTRDFLAFFVAEAVKGYRERMQEAEKGNTTHTVENTNELLAMLKAVLKEYGYHGAVCQLNQALRA